jgi:hypothetical protein
MRRIRSRCCARRAADERDEFAPINHSVTSLASTSNLQET